MDKEDIEEAIEVLEDASAQMLIDNGHWAKTIEREAHEAIAKATGGEI